MNIFKGISTKFTQAFKKYGFENFSLQILEYCDKLLLIEREQIYIDLISLKYNISPTAGSPLGNTHSPTLKSGRGDSKEN